MRERIWFGELEEVHATDCILGVHTAGSQDRESPACSARGGGCGLLERGTLGTARVLLPCVPSVCRPRLTESCFCGSRPLKNRALFRGSPHCFGLSSNHSPPHPTPPSPPSAHLARRPPVPARPLPGTPPAAPSPGTLLLRFSTAGLVARSEQGRF